MAGLVEGSHGRLRQLGSGGDQVPSHAAWHLIAARRRWRGPALQGGAGELRRPRGAQIGYWTEADQRFMRRL